MAKDVADQQIRDTNTYNFPISHDDDSAVFQYVNNLDAEVTVDLQGTYDSDDDFSDAHAIASKTISSNSTDSYSLTDPWDQVRVVVTASTAPTSNSFIAKKHNE
jgi:hypothetical protein